MASGYLDVGTVSIAINAIDMTATLTTIPSFRFLPAVITWSKVLHIRLQGLDRNRRKITTVVITIGC